VALANDRARIARFGTFAADLEKKELRKAGRIIHIRGQPWDVLVALLERAGSIVSRDVLEKRLWANDTFVDFERGLNKAISRIRGVLGDAADNPRFLETVPGEGYRFIAPVDWIRPETGRRKITLAFVASPHIRYWIAAGVAAIVVLTSVTWYYLGRRNPKGVVETKITSRVPEVPVEAAALSPDGKYLAFSDRAGLWMQVVSTHEMHRLEAPPNSAITHMAWLTDSSSLLINATASMENFSRLWTLSIFGGSPRPLRDEAGEGRPSPDGKKIAFTRENGREAWTISTTGEDPQRILTVGKEERITGFIWSRDSRNLVYSVVPADYKSHEVTLNWRSLESGKTAVVLSEPRLTEFCGTSDGVLAYSRLESPFNVSEMNLWKMRIDMATGQVLQAPRSITQLRGYTLSSLSISSDGRVLAAIKGMSHIAAYTLSLGAGDRPPGTLTLLTYHDRNDYPVTWDTSSHALYLDSNRNGKWEIFRQDIEQHSSEYVVGSTFSARFAVLSSDGRWVLYQRRRQPTTTWSTPVSLLRVPVAGGPPQEVWSGQGYYRIRCSPPQGNRCVLATSSADRAFVVFSDFDPITGKGKDLTKIATPVDFGTIYYSWDLSPDGSEIALGEPGERGTRIRIISLVGAPERQVTVSGWRDFKSIRWAADGTGFFLLVETNDMSTFLRVDHLGNARVLVDKNRQIHFDFAPSPDGRWFAFAEVDLSANVFLFSGF
jgi:DNA-binding winged helix-turn-helix (wHTH) protein/Tol biopolymer transport system component